MKFIIAFCLIAVILPIGLITVNMFFAAYLLDMQPLKQGYKDLILLSLPVTIISVWMMWKILDNIVPCIRNWVNR